MLHNLNKLEETIMNSENEYDFETARERKITLNLSDADIYKLSAQAGRGGLKVNELLENFIGDVINRTFSEGWGFAREWANIIEGKTEDSLLSYSLKKGITPGNIFGKYRDEIIKEYLNLYPNANIEEEIEKCQEWRKEYDLLREGEPTQAKKQLSPLELGNLQAKALENVKAIVKEKNLYEELVNNIDVNEIVLDEPMDQLEPGIEI